MPADDSLDATTPVFTQEEVYVLGGFIATRAVEEELEVDPIDAEKLIEIIDEAVEVALDPERSRE